MKPTNPSPLALCLLLANRNHLAGVVLERIAHWSQYGRAKIPGKDGMWIANVRQWWLRECCLSPDQWDRTIRKLKKWGLIERRQWWFAGRSILHVRATELTKSFLAASTTWEAASEFLNDLGLNKSGKSADHGSANVLTSNGVILSGAKIASQAFWLPWLAGAEAARSDGFAADTEVARTPASYPEMFENLSLTCGRESVSFI